MTDTEPRPADEPDWMGHQPGAMLNERDHAAAIAALIVARDNFRALFHGSPVASVIYDQIDDRLMDANPRFLDFFGLDAADALGRAGAELDGLLAESQRRALVAAVPEQGVLSNVPLALRNGAGDERSVLVSLVRIVQDDRDGILASFIDVTEMRRAEENQRRLVSELSLAEQAERQRISSILHDDLQQRLYALQVMTTAARGRAADRPALAAELDTIAEGLRNAGDLTRRLSVDLAPPILHGEDLYHTLLWLGSQMKEQFGLNVSVTHLTPWRELEQGVRVVLFQVVRELLFNVAKHAGVRDVAVAIAQRDDTVVIEVSDAGVGFDPALVLDAPAGSSHGLTMTRQRLALYGGRLSIAAGPGQGTTVTITVPAGPLHA